MYQECRHVLDERISRGHQLLDDLKNDAQNDAKSSAGDKHETAISMMQLEQEKLNRQLHEYVKQKDALEKLAPDTIHTRIMAGSIVVTNKGIFYLITAIGKIQFNQTEVQCISPQAPLALALAGKKSGDSIQFMNQTYEVLEII